jgi:uncharacterized membrane protein YoaK (UPF0700 family)
VPPEPLAARLLAVLAATAGYLDAVCVARLGGPFASVITGNLVQLGRGIAADGRLAVRAAVAVAGYTVGVAAGSVGLGHAAERVAASGSPSRPVASRSAACPCGGNCWRRWLVAVPTRFWITVTAGLGPLG